MIVEKRKNVTGIYTIINIITNKVYVGQAIDVYRRLKDHRRLLRAGLHKNLHLQSSWNKYGEEVFIFDSLVDCIEEHLYSEEHYWVNILQANKDCFGYNIALTHPYGKVRTSNDTKVKMSIVRKGKKLKGKWREEFSKMWLGRKHSEETKAKISNKKKGVGLTEAHKKKLSIKTKGRKLSDETREKMRNSAKGVWEKRKLDPNYQNFLKEIGKTTKKSMTPEVRMKISTSLKKRNKQ